MTSSDVSVKWVILFPSIFSLPQDVVSCCRKEFRGDLEKDEKCNLNLKGKEVDRR